MLFTETVDNATKFAPITLSVTSPLPANTEDGEVAVILGTGLVAGLIVKVRGSVTPPPGAGVETVIWTVPAVWISVAGICAVNSFVVKKIGARIVEFQLTEDAGVKLYPVMASVKLGSPATTLVGEMETILGAG